MPSTVAIQTGLTYDATDLQDFPRVFLQIVSGGPWDTPETRGEDSRTPYRDGQTYGPRREDRLPIMLDGWVAGEGADEAAQRADTATARQELRVLFDPTRGPAVLHLETEDGTEWEIEAYPDVVVWQAAEQGIPTHREVSVRLIAIDPPHWTAA
jgi:hypothetical protein